MKTLKLTITAIALLFGLFALSPAMATPSYGDSTSAPGNSGNAPGHNSDGTNGNGNGNGNGGVGNGNGNGNQNHLPINGGIVFLMIAGVAIGIKVVTNRVKKLQPQKA